MQNTLNDSMYHVKSAMRCAFMHSILSTEPGQPWTSLPNRRLMI